MAMDTRDGQASRDATLPPDTYMYMQNIGKGGVISVFKGPFVITQSGQDVPVRYDSAARKFVKSESLEAAVSQCPRANEGDYIVLENPADSGKFPVDAQQQAVGLKKGRKVIIPGPWSEALWPGQVATVVEGHRLRSNQFLIATVYNAEEAEKNWETGTVVVSQTDTDPDDDKLSPEQKAEKAKAAATAAGVVKPGQPPEQAAKTAKKGLPKPDSFAVGTRIVIKGSDVSFYIPCTGIEVQKDKDQKFVREAVTLEQLEYACLVDENGKKEYPKGPKVVFPKPTQVFEEDKKGRRKFRPVELNTINGIHLKVTADFEGPDIEKDVTKKRNYREGEELFVTGKTLSIYYPREELAVIEYGQGNKKHFSTAIPKGEGRYVIDREKGSIDLKKGPVMLLPDPRNQILVRRVLSQDECELWYPGNAAAKIYNAELAQIMAESPSGRSGSVSEGDVRKRGMAPHGLSNFAGRKGLEVTAGAALQSAFSDSDDFTPEETGDAGGVGGTMARGTKYTTPRQLTLNTKFDGVPRIEVWPGYAVLVVGSDGKRRVVQGPEVILLEYDEKLGFMKLSTGKPKSTDTLYMTSYLCVQNNQVGDIVAFESKDHVKGTIKISLRVNFEGETEAERLRWFGVDNYVKFLTDHIRSIIAGMAKRKTIAEIKGDYVNLVREAILGAKTAAAIAAGDKSESLRTSRPGLYFEANGMRVVEAEVLDITLSDVNIAKLLDNAQHKTVATNIEIDAAKKDLEALEEKEGLERKKADALYATMAHKRGLEKAAAAAEVELLAAKVAVDLKVLDNHRAKAEKTEDTTDFQSQKALARAKLETAHQQAVDQATQALKLGDLEATTKAACERFLAAKDGLYEVITSMQRDDIALKLTEAVNVERFLSGDGVGSSLSNLLAVVPALKGFFDNATAGQQERANGTGKNRLATPELAAKK